MLSYSIYSLLNGVKSQLTPGDVDTYLQPISEV